MPTGNKDWVIVDLDGTLSDCLWRVPAALARDWEAFHDGMEDDEILEPTATLLKAMRQGLSYDNVKFMILTGRPERYRNRTLKWLAKKELLYLFDEMIMRPENDYTPTGDLKINQLTDFFGDIETVCRRVLVVLEDRESCVAMMREVGLNVWAVNEGTY